jgi:hypothetical protein
MSREVSFVGSAPQKNGTLPMVLLIVQITQDMKKNMTT